MAIIKPDIKRKALLLQMPFLIGAKKFIGANIIECEMLAFAAMALYVFRYIPYANIILSTSVSFFILVVTSQILFRLSASYISIVSLLLFPVALIQLLEGNFQQAESTGNLIYFFLCYSCILYVIDFRKFKK